MECKTETQIDIVAANHRTSISDPEKVPFSLFRKVSQRRENTWVISLLVVLNLVAFSATMFVNDCWRSSHADCSLSPLGRFSFQPLAENPLLGPSASTILYSISCTLICFIATPLLLRLDSMGALRKSLVMNGHEIWRLFTSPLLHAGLFHLIINLCTIAFVGIHLEQEFGPLRIGIIYMLSAITGSFVAALFLVDRPSVTSSGALFGLIGAMLSGLIRNWNCYTKKFAALVAILSILAINLSLGLFPYVNNFSNMGGFICGFLLGFVLLFTPRIDYMAKNKGGLFDYDKKISLRLRQKFDRPVLRVVSLILLIILVAGLVTVFIRGVNMNKYCGWCQNIDCVRCKLWSCNDKPMHCESRISGGRLTMTCLGNDKFRVFPFTDYSQARLQDLCHLICS